MASLQFIDEAKLEGQKVLARFDFNVPLDKSDSSIITDTTRVDLALPTIQYLLDNKVKKLILMSHLGRPKGQIDPKFSLEPVAKYLAEKLKTNVVLSDGVTGAGIKEFIGLPDTKVILLQNLRYAPGEESNDKEFARELSEYADLYVNDAFGAVHRKHASVHGITDFFKGRRFGGLLLKKEVLALEKIANAPAKPFVAIVGGAKVSDKIKTIEALLRQVNHILIGGAMAYPFLKAKGYNVGKSLCSDEDVTLAKKIMQQDKGDKLVFPIDHIISDDLNGDATTCSETNIPDNQMGLDIGPRTRELFEEKLSGAKTVFWNGPMGLFETAQFAEGTMSIAKMLSKLDAFTVVGGGDSVSAANKSGLADQLSHVSTGGGASLEFIEKGQLPGVQALKFGANL